MNDSDARTNQEPRTNQGDDPSLGELVGRLTDDMGTLVQDHVQLAKVEIVEEVRTASKGSGLLGGGAFAGYLAVLMLSFAAAWALAEVMPEGVAFAIVGVLWGLLAAALALMGRKEMKTIDPQPTQTIAEVKEDARWVTEQTN